MKIKQLVSLTLTFIAITAGILWFSGQQTARANSEQTRHKVVAPTGIFSPNTAGVTLLQDYGSYHLWLVSDDALARLPERSKQQVTLADEMDYLLFDARPFNTQQESLASLDLPDGLTAVNTTGGSLHLIQFVGPIKSEWLTAVEATGANLVHYVAHNGYMVWADDASRARLDALVAEGDFLQFSALHQPYFKLGPSIRERLTNGSDPAEVVPVVIQIYNNRISQSQTPELIKEVTIEQIAPWSSILAFENVIVSLPAGELAALARQPDVVWVGERFERELMDEVQNQIIAGNLDGAGTGPSGPGYLAWLNGFGVSTNPADYPIVDVTDDGIGNGTVNSNDETFHVLGNIGNATRLAYVDNCTNSPSGEGVDGHGHINTSIVGGYDTRSGFPFQDPGGFQRGMGVSPYGRMGGVRIFDPGFDLSACGGTDTGLIKRIQDNGPKISSNSWGCGGCAGSYDDSSQAFDVGVRDADLTEAGNQELTFIFAAGNSGPGAGTVGTPGNGKNMITVGASENDRPSDEDGNWTDGCGIGPTGADNAMDVIGFSSRGPSPGGRVKPEIIAPGTHIQGTASTNAGYTGNSVCDQYRPSGQTEFAASSGTSHSTPAVSGVASLYYYWLENEYSITPSPALMKAYLTAHPTYLTGVSANDTLPSNSQGYGMPNIGVGLDDALRAFVNQEVVFDNSGETWTWDGSVADPSRPVRIVMAYTDAPGAIGTSPEVNNLNLTAVIAGNTYLGNEFSGQWSVTGGTADNDNNYEAVFLPAGTTGPIQITVAAFNIAGDGVPNSGDGTDQDFALVCYNCAQGSDFTLSATPNDLEICAPDDAVYTINVGSVLGFNDAVTLSAFGHPAGTTTNFSVNGQPAPYTSTLTIGNTGAAAAGSYSIDVVGVAPTSTHTTTVGLDVFTGAPGAPTLLTPADGATNVDLVPTFTWNAASQAASYYLEVAADSGFTTLVYTNTVSGTSDTSGVTLTPLTTYYWRVTSINVCGTGATSSVFSFTTSDIPPILLVDDDDNGPDVRAFYTDALNNLGAQYDIWDTGNSDNEPNASQLQPYSTVIWFTGDEFGGAAGPGAAGEAALSSWLNDGNCLFISSQDYYFDRGLTSFMDTYLGVASATSDVAQTTVTGAGTVFSGLGPYALSYPFTNWSDIVNADGAPAEVAFTGNQGNAAVNKDSGVYRTTFWGFPWEAIPTAGNRETAMQTVLNWCGALGATGSLEGQVTDADSSQGIDGATVTVVGTGTYATTTDANGDYSITLPIGTYDVTASAPNYVPVTVTAIDIITDTTVVQDFELQGSHLTFSPPSIERTVVLSGVVTTTVTVTNTGPLTIEWSVDIGNWGGPITTAVGLNPIAIPASDGSFVRGLYAPSAGLAPADGVAAAPSSAPLVEIPFGTTAYAVEAVNGFFTAFDLDTPETLPNLAPYTAIAFPGAGEVVDGYAYVIDGTTMTQIDLGTGGSVGTTPVTPPPGSHSYSGMALDPTSGTVYVASCDISTSILYTIDMGSGTTTQVGTITNSPCTIAIAIDGNGDLWGHDIVNDSFLSIDKATAAGTIVGPLGFDANFGQGMGWDAATDQVYLAAFNNGAFQPELRVADRSTGNTTLIGVLGSTSPGGLTQLPWLGTELSTGPGWAYAVPEGGIIPPNSTSTFEVVFDARLVNELGTYTADLDFSGTFVNVVPTMPLTMHVVAEAIAGVQVSGDMTGSGAPDDMVMYVVTITNTGNVADTFNLTLSGNNWTTTLLDTSVTLIEGQSTTVMVHVTVPTDANDGDTDTVTVTATSVNDNTVSDSTNITTTADVEGYVIYLPIIMKP